MTYFSKMMFSWNDVTFKGISSFCRKVFFRSRFKNIKMDRNVLNRIFSDFVITLKVQQSTDYKRLNWTTQSRFFGHPSLSCEVLSAN